MSIRLAIMQPYFFPYLGYFSLIDATNHWVVFDTPQYIRKGWVNRNRVLKKGEGWKYIGINVQKASRETPINEILCHQDYDWYEIILKNLDYYRENRAPYYYETVNFLKDTFSIENAHLAPILVHCLSKTCDYIDLPFRYDIYSQIDVEIGPVTHAGEWALRISEALNAHTYINPSGGREIFDRKQFKSSGIKLQFLKPILPEYDQKSGDFIRGLSIIDALMWNSPKQVYDMIKQYKLVE